MDHQATAKVYSLIRNFKAALRKYHSHIYSQKRLIGNNQQLNFYEKAKKAETEERNLIKALELYIIAIQKNDKKDSSIKDFASSLHQLGFTKEAVKFMDDCVPFYDGNKNKYFRLRDNLEIQFRPTGKHLCRFLLIENICLEIKQKTEEQIKNSLFTSTKRIKSMKFLENFQLLDQINECPKQQANNLLLQFQSFSAAKKTLETFKFDEWFDSNLYWVNMNDMRIVCAALDGKNDFEEGFIVTEQLINYHIWNLKQEFWVSFGQEIYHNKLSNGFINLLSTHLIKESLIQKRNEQANKENIFESSKIKNNKIKKL